MRGGLQGPGPQCPCSQPSGPTLAPSTCHLRGSKRVPLLLLPLTLWVRTVRCPVSAGALDPITVGVTNGHTQLMGIMHGEGTLRW